mgnify:CR=1 FL=1
MKDSNHKELKNKEKRILIPKEKKDGSENNKDAKNEHSGR